MAGCDGCMEPIVAPCFAYTDEGDRCELPLGHDGYHHVTVEHDWAQDPPRPAPPRDPNAPLTGWELYLMDRYNRAPATRRDGT